MGTMKRSTYKILLASNRPRGFNLASKFLVSAESFLGAYKDGEFGDSFDAKDMADQLPWFIDAFTRIVVNDEAPDIALNMRRGRGQRKKDPMEAMIKRYLNIYTFIISIHSTKGYSLQKSKEAACQKFNRGMRDIERGYAFFSDVLLNECPSETERDEVLDELENEGKGPRRLPTEK
ncbi:MAG: hypothetical protein QM718_04890 [Steroidobacteraceae bacterium]